MINIKQILITMALVAASLQFALAQSVAFEVVFNENNCLYEAHMQVLNSISDPDDVFLGTAAFTLVVPAGTNMDENIIATGVQPPGSVWRENQPAVSVGETGKSYHKFATNGGEFTVPLTQGSDVTLFTFALPNEGCLSGVRVFKNDNLMPPESNPDEQPLGLDFNNSLQVLISEEIYDGNVNNTGIVLPSPTPAPSSSCTPAEIQLNTNPPAAHPACLSMAYSWDGPNGFTSTLENPTRQIAGDGQAESGDYNITVTDLNGCQEVRTVNVDATACSLVPVELSAFNVEKGDNMSLLDWETESELNNEHFEVERSLDGKTFIQIGQVNGSGTTSETKNYEFTDRVPEDGMNFYRLKQVDFNGQFEYSEIRSVEFAGEDAFQVYPNPAGDYLIVDSPGLKSQSNVTYKLINELGQVAKRGSLEAHSKLNISDLESGIYFIQILNAQKSILGITKIYVLK